MGKENSDRGPAVPQKRVVKLTVGNRFHLPFWPIKEKFEIWPATDCLFSEQEQKLVDQGKIQDPEID